MARLALLSIALFGASSVLAQYDQFVFATNATRWKCPKGLGFDCVAPQICSHEPVLDKWYCCGPEKGSVCWSGSTTCSGTEKNTPGSNQLGCGSYCCLNSREECTQRTNQINICWATPPNPLTNVTAAKMNETFSSLSSASPTASALTFDIKAALSTATPTPSITASPSGTSDPTAVSQTASGSPTSATTQVGESSPGLSGGAIGGIVVGVLGGLILIGGLVFFLLRKKKTAAHPNKSELESVPASASSGNPYNHNAFAQEGPPQQEKYRHEVFTPAQGYPQQHYPQYPHELDAGPGYAEVDGSKPVTHGHHPSK